MTDDSRERVLFHMTDTDPAPVKAPVDLLDTTTGSAAHTLFRYLDRSGGRRALALLSLYVIAVALTFLPLLVGAWLGGSLFGDDKLKLPFFHDWTILFAFLVSFPCLLILTVTDQHILDQSLKMVDSEGTIAISPEDKKRVAVRWNKRFLIFNLVGQGLAAMIGASIAYLNYSLFKPGQHWMFDRNTGALLGVGYVFMFCLFLFYALIVIYVYRNIALSLLLRDIVRHSRLQLLPCHPDRCGGLRPVGRLGLRNQYALSIFGVNVVLMAWGMIHDIGAQGGIHDSLYVLMIAGVIAYLILGPIVFLAPLLPFRTGMQANKAELRSEIVQCLRTESERLRKQLLKATVTKEDEELIERLRKMCTAIEELPVWPFDPGTVRKFMTAYVIPIVSAGYPVAKAIPTSWLDRLTWW
jgi:hypothetical protein